MTLDVQQNGQLVPSTILLLSKDQITKRDIFGRTILHALLLCNRHDLLRHLLKNPHAKEVLGVTDYENGWNCLHYVVFHKRILCFKVLMEYLRRETGSYLMPNSLMYDLVRCKDRNKYTPFQLLDNDMKDLIWYPEYVDKHDRFHLAYRYTFCSPEHGEATTTNTNPTTNPSAAAGPTMTALQAKPDHFRLRRSSIESRHDWWVDTRGGSDLYVLGSNKNYILGLGDIAEASLPCKLALETFEAPNRLQTYRFKQVGLAKNHSLVLTTCGKLYSCGLGSRGRLGHGSNNLRNCMRHVRVPVDELDNDHSVVQFAISENHSVFLTTNNQVYAFGLNECGQLGISNSLKAPTTSESFEASPVRVYLGDLRRLDEVLLGVAVCDTSSVAWSHNSLLFWGLNSGQMGVPADPTRKVNKKSGNGAVQSAPIRVSLRDGIKHVQVTPQCTIVVTSNNNIHVFAQHQHTKLPQLPVNIAFEKHFDIFRPTKLTKRPTITKLSAKSHQLVCLLLDNGDVVSFSFDPNSANFLKTIRYTTLWKSYDRDMKVVDLDTSVDGSVLLCTRNGSTFIKSSQAQRRGSANDVIPIPVKKNKFRRVFNLNRVVRVCCDASFSSFAYIRDDIDVLPFEVPVNNVLNDLQYLSPVIDTSDTRKQTDLLRDGSHTASYVTNFLGSCRTLKPDGDGDDDNTVLKDADILRRTYCERYDVCHHGTTSMPKLDVEMSPQDEFRQLLLDNLANQQWIPSSALRANYYDFDLTISSHTGSTVIPIHHHLFELRSTVFKGLINGDVVLEGNVRGVYRDGSLTFDSVLQTKALLIFVHYLYTGIAIDIWNAFPNRSSCPPVVAAIKRDFILLLSAFNMADLNQKNAITQLQLLGESLLQDSPLVTIVLADGIVSCHPSLLSSRSAYFETVLSDAWNGSQTLHLSGVTSKHFAVIMRHINGTNDLSLFDAVDIEPLHYHDEFINFVMEIVEMADELLLLELKDIGQLAIKDLIDLENVLTILRFADTSNAKKLFLACSWYIFNNLEMFLLDYSFHDLPLDILATLEKHILFFHHCKLADFSDTSGTVNSAIEYNWMQDQSSKFVKDFLFSRDNAHRAKFMTVSRTSFTPLVDERYLPKQKPVDKRRLSRKSVSARKNSALLELQEEMAKLRRTSDSKPSNDSKNESAIEDEEDFEVVTRRRSKGQARARIASPTYASPGESPPLSALQSQNLSSTSLAKAAKASKQGSPNVAAPSTSIKWNSKGLDAQPVLGETLVKIEQPKVAINKFKFGQRPSQKERRMQLQVGAEAKPSTKSEPIEGLPWKNGDGDLRKMSNPSLEALPVLGSSWTQSEASSSASMATIMLQESLKLEDAKAWGVKKSLQEIQQEQEFEKWWQQEAERVQRQQNPKGRRKPKKPH